MSRSRDAQVSADDNCNGSTIRSILSANMKSNLFADKNGSNKTTKKTDIKMTDLRNYYHKIEWKNSNKNSLI